MTDAKAPTRPQISLENYLQFTINTLGRIVAHLNANGSHEVARDVQDAVVMLVNTQEAVAHAGEDRLAVPHLLSDTPSDIDDEDEDSFTVMVVRPSCLKSVDSDSDALPYDAKHVAEAICSDEVAQAILDVLQRRNGRVQD